MICTENNLKLHVLTKPRFTYPHWPVPTTDTHWCHSPLWLPSKPSSEQSRLSHCPEISIYAKLLYCQCRKVKDPFISQKNIFLPCFSHYFSLNPGHGRTLKPVDFTEVFVKIHFRSSIRYFFSALTIGLTPGFVSIKHSLKHRKS